MPMLGVRQEAFSGDAGRSQRLCRASTEVTGPHRHGPRISDGGVLSHGRATDQELDNEGGDMVRIARPAGLRRRGPREASVTDLAVPHLGTVDHHVPKASTYVPSSARSARIPRHPEWCL